MRVSRYSQVVILSFGMVAPVLACVDSETYAINNQKPASKHYVWYLNGDTGGNSALGPSGTCSNKTLAEVFDCARAAAEAHPGVAGCTGAKSWSGSPTNYGTPGDYQDWQQYGNALMANGSQCNGMSFRTRAAVGWPSGYEHEQCSECGDGTKGRLQPVRAETASAAEIIIGSCLDGCAVADVKIDPIGINKDVDGSFYFLPWVRLSGDACVGGEPEIPPEDPDPADEPTGEVCKESAEGTEVCRANAYGENCGYINGDFVCLGKTDPDECWVNPDGSRLCGESAPTPPVPDSGVPGVKATPDDELSSVGPGGTSNEYNYYNSATVAGSSRDAGDTGENPNRPNSTDPRTAPTPVVNVGDGEGDGEGDGGGGPFTGPEMETVCTFQECTDEFLASVQAAPLVAAWTSIGSSIPAGACPDADISVFGEVYSFTDFACSIWDDTVVPLLSLVFLFVWPFIGLRIIMSA
jgi:hypothetical protein